MTQNSTYLVWFDVPDGKRCHLTFLENVENDYELMEGIQLAPRWPEEATYRMDPDYKSRIQLTDSLINQGFAIVVSEKLKALLEASDVQGNEYLPVVIVNHKGRTTKDKYFVANQFDQQDALDQQKSVFTKNTIDTTQIDTVKQLVIDHGKIKPTAKLFRLKYFKRMVLVRSDLADKIQSAGMTGVSFMPIDQYIEFTNS